MPSLFQLNVRVEHNLFVFRRFVLIVFRWPRLELFLKCPYFGAKIEALCFYETVLFFLKACNARKPGDKTDNWHYEGTRRT